jgi:hypothetical protein
MEEKSARNLLRVGEHADLRIMLAELDRLAEVLRDEQQSEAAIHKATDRLLDAVRRAAPAERTEGVQRLSPLIRLADTKRAGVAATLCGAMVENGADPTPMEIPVLERLTPALRKLDEDPAPEPEPTPEPATPIVTPEAEIPRKQPGLLGMLWRLFVARRKFRRAMKQYEKELAARPVNETEAIVNAFSPSAIAMFSASPALRSAHPEVGELAKSLQDRVAGCHCIQSLFGVLENEPLLVIEPATQTGILARLSGTDINFTLTMLLMHHFPGPDGEPKSRLTPKAASALSGRDKQTGEWVTGVWDLCNWTALQNDLSLPGGLQGSEKWIWNEGTPADIEVFEGRRVILLGPVSYVRTWPAQRTFAAMQPELRIEQVLTREEVRGWLEKMAGSRG